MIAAHSRELPPMTAAWSARRPRAAVRSGEPDADLVPPWLGVDEHAVEVEQDGVEPPRAVLHVILVEPDSHALEAGGPRLSQRTPPGLSGGTIVTST